MVGRLGGYHGCALDGMAQLGDIIEARKLQPASQSAVLGGGERGEVVDIGR